jgi:hypothetical protein
LEDVVSIVDGRESLAADARDTGGEVRDHVRREIAKLLANPAFIDALPGFLLPDAASQSRIAIVLAWLGEIASS